MKINNHADNVKWKHEKHESIKVVVGWVGHIYRADLDFVAKQISILL